MTPLHILFVTSQWPSAENPGLAPFVKREVESLRRAGALVDVFHYSGGWTPVGYARAIARFRRQLQQADYDLVQVRFGQCGLIALSQRRLPVVVRFGGSDLLGWRDTAGREPLASKVLRTVSRFVAHRATQVIIVSEGMAPHLPPRPYHVIPSGVDLAVFRPGNAAEARQQLKLPAEERKLVLFAANPRNVIKRYELAQAAVALLPETLPAELVVAHGVPHEQMPLYMQACDALVLTSEHEGSPNVVKEALACNLPVVSVDVGDVRERIGRLPGCVLCTDEQPQTIAAGLAQVLQAVRPAGLREAVLPLDSELLAQRMIAIYQETIAAQHRRAVAWQERSL